MSDNSNCNNKYLKKRKSATTLPLCIYIVILVVSILFILISYCNCLRQTYYSSLLSNIGSSMLASVIVGGIIDYTNTKIKESIEKKHADELLYEYRTAFLGLRNSVLEVAEIMYGSDEQKRTFDEWIDYLFVNTESDEETEDNFEDLFSIIFYVEKINKIAKDLHSVLLLNIENTAIDKPYRDHLKRVASLSAHIDREYNSYSKITLVGVNIKKLVSRFIEHNKKCSTYFETPYSEDTWDCEEKST